MERERITPKQKKQAYESQHGKCAICGVDSGSQGPRSIIKADYVLEDGGFRGLLCFYCKRTITLAQDDPVYLMKLILYKKKWANQENKREEIPGAIDISQKVVKPQED